VSSFLYIMFLYYPRSDRLGYTSVASYPSISVKQQVFLYHGPGQTIRIGIIREVFSVMLFQDLY